MLRDDVREIGVAIVPHTGAASRGPFAVHHAVQLFGHPLAGCGERPGDNDRSAIEEAKGAIAQKRTRITEFGRELDALHARMSTAADRREHSCLTQSYNARVDQYNLLVSEAQPMQEALEHRIDLNNARVEAFNACRRE